MTEFVLRNIPSESKLYISIDEGPLKQYTDKGFVDLSVGEHLVKIVCKNKTDISFYFDHLSSRHKGSFMLCSLNYEVLSFEYNYRIRVLKRAGKIEIDFLSEEYKNFLGYKSKKRVISLIPENVYIIGSRGPFFTDKKQKLKFMLFQVFNVFFSMLPYLLFAFFHLLSDIRFVLNQTPMPYGGYRNLSPIESIFILDIPLTIIVLGYCIYLIVKYSRKI